MAAVALVIAAITTTAAVAVLTLDLLVFALVRPGIGVNRRLVAVVALFAAQDRLRRRAARHRRILLQLAGSLALSEVEVAL
jgi:hypothetical protein